MRAREKRVSQHLLRLRSWSERKRADGKKLTEETGALCYETPHQAIRNGLGGAKRSSSLEGGGCAPTAPKPAYSLPGSSPDVAAETTL